MEDDNGDEGDLKNEKLAVFTFLLGAPSSRSTYSRENQAIQIVSVIARSGLSFGIVMIIMMKLMAALPAP